MLPKTHIMLGAVFSVLCFFLGISIFNCMLIFLSSFLIDFDHYVWFYMREKSHNLKKAYYHLKGLKHEKPVFMLFHSIEFHILVLLFGFVWKGFFFIFVGMLFHSLIDIIQMAYEKELRLREFSFIRYLVKRKTRYYH